LPRLAGQGVAHRAAAVSSICQASEKRPLALNERPKSREETPNVGSDAACETASLNQHVGIRTVSQSAKTPNLVDDPPSDAFTTQPQRPSRHARFRVMRIWKSRK